MRVKCLDVEVGSATFAPAAGLAHAVLQPTDDYPTIAPFAREVGAWLSVHHYWSPVDGDITDVIADRWHGERVWLEDDFGRELAVSHVVVVEPPRSQTGARITLVADFRPDHARVAAVVLMGTM